MPNVKDIKRTMKASDIPKEVIAEFDFPKPSPGSYPEDVMNVVGQMDKLLTKEQSMAIMEQQGCCKDSTAEEHRVFGALHQGKTLKEKVASLNESSVRHKGICKLNDDGTLTICFKIERCVCRVVGLYEKGRGQKESIPLTFCGCCAGHLRYTHKFSLGVDLRLKDIVSSAAHSCGKEHCEFIFHIER